MKSKRTEVICTPDSTAPCAPIFMIYLNRPDLLRRAVTSLGEYQHHLVVIDNSPQGDFELDGFEGEVMRPPVQLCCNQSYNWALKRVRAEGYERFFIMHSDGLVSPRIVEKLWAKADDLDSRGSNWGIVFTNYDVLCLCRSAALTPFSWDHHLPMYYMDADFFRQLLLAGIELVDSHLPVIHQEGGSNTLRSDTAIQCYVKTGYPAWQQYYRAKWGGDRGEERFTVPFDGAAQSMLEIMSADVLSEQHDDGTVAANSPAYGNSAWEVRVRMAGIGEPTLSVVIPTRDGQDMERCLRSITEQDLMVGDEILVVGDTESGPLSHVQRLVANLGAPFRYLAHAAGYHAWGHPQRNAGIASATGDFLVFIDDDDAFLPSAFANIRRALSEQAEPKPHLFRFIAFDRRVLWQREAVEEGHIGGRQFVVPNVPVRLGSWSDRYNGDFDFVRSTLDLWPEGSLVWRQEVISIARPAA